MKFIASLILSFLLAILVGCQGLLSHSEHKVAEQYIKSKPHYQKPGASVSLVYSQVNIDEADTAYDIDITINSRYHGGDLELSVLTSDGLELVDGEIDTDSTLTQGEMTFPYTVSASQEGRYYIYANAKVTDRNGKHSFRSLTLIVQVGEDSDYEKDTSVEEQSSKSETSQSFGDPVSMSIKEEIIN